MDPLLCHGAAAPVWRPFLSALSRLKVWLPPSGQEIILDLLNRSLGRDGWIEALPTRAEVGVFADISPPKGLPGDLSLIHI